MRKWQKACLHLREGQVRSKVPLLLLQSEHGLLQVEDRTSVEMTGDVGYWPQQRFSQLCRVNLWHESRLVQRYRQRKERLPGQPDHQIETLAELPTIVEAI